MKKIIGGLVDHVPPCAGYLTCRRNDGEQAIVQGAFYCDTASNGDNNAICHYYYPEMYLDSCTCENAS